VRDTALLLFIAGLPFMAPTRAAASDVDPVGDVISNPSGSADCNINAVAASQHFCLEVTTVSMATIRLGNFGFACAADAAHNPCSISLGGHWGTNFGTFSKENLPGFPTGLTTLQMNFNATVTGASSIGVSSGTVQYCIVGDACLLSPFQLTGNGLISITPVMQSVNLAANYQVTATVRIDLPAGATLFFNDVSLLFIQGMTLGAVQVCKIAGPGVTLGSNFLFRVQGPDFHVFLPASANAAPGGCSFALNLFTGASIVLQEGAVNGTTISSISGGTSSNLAEGSAGLLIGNNTTTVVTFTDKVLGTQGCGPGYFKNHPDGFSTPYTPNTIVGSIFTGVLDSLSRDTLHEALGGGGGPGLEGAEKQLLRVGVSALLNAANPKVEFSYSLATLIDLVNTALASGNVSAIRMLAGTLDQADGGGCPLN
jgi:hypothetical protein